MKLELENKIVNAFPELFYYYFNTESRYPLMFGIETGDGWYYLIQNLCKKIKNWSNKNEQVRFTQIKEKYGELRIYSEGYFEEVEIMIDEASKKSKTICENCGSTENVKPTKPWINYLCKDCREKIQKD